MTKINRQKKKKYKPLNDNCHCKFQKQLKDEDN